MIPEWALVRIFGGKLIADVVRYVYRYYHAAMLMIDWFFFQRAREYWLRSGLGPRRRGIKFYGRRRLTVALFAVSRGQHLRRTAAPKVARRDRLIACDSVDDVRNHHFHLSGRKEGGCVGPFAERSSNGVTQSDFYLSSGDHTGLVWQMNVNVNVITLAARLSRRRRGGHAASTQAYEKWWRHSVPCASSSFIVWKGLTQATPRISGKPRRQLSEFDKSNR